MSKFCQNCGAQMEDHIAFCAACGSKFVDNQQPPVYQEPPMQQPAPAAMNTPLRIPAPNGAIRIVAIVLAAIMLFGLILPLSSATEDYADLLEDIGDDEVLEGVTGEDMMNLNIFEYFSILSSDSSESVYDGAEGIINFTLILAILLIAGALLAAVLQKDGLAIGLTIPSIIVVNLGIIFMDLNPRAFDYGVGYYFFMIAAAALIVTSAIASSQKSKARKMAYMQQWGV